MQKDFRSSSAKNAIASEILTNRLPKNSLKVHVKSKKK